MINELYHSMKFSCSSCGGRFNNLELLKDHLDWHFKENLDNYEKKINKKMIDRKNFLSLEV